jgi:hypothetical protein
VPAVPVSVVPGDWMAPAGGAVVVVVVVVLSVVPVVVGWLSASRPQAASEREPATTAAVARMRETGIALMRVTPDHL